MATPPETSGTPTGPKRDLEDSLRALIGDTAEVDPTYGGFEIRLTRPNDFPWAEVMELLASIRQDIWVRRFEGRLLIVSKPPAV